jgi:hypothetical protein
MAYYPERKIYFRVSEGRAHVKNDCSPPASHGCETSAVDIAIVLSLFAYSFDLSADFGKTGNLDELELYRVISSNWQGFVRVYR